MKHKEQCAPSNLFLTCLNAGHLRISRGVSTRRPADMQRSHNGRTKEGEPVKSVKAYQTNSRQFDIPEDSAEYNSRHTGTPYGPTPTPPITPSRSNSYESGEPKDHRDELDSSNSILMGESWEPGWREDEVGDGEEGPEGGKEHEVYRGRGPAVAAPPACGISERIDDYGCVSM